MAAVAVKTSETSGTIGKKELCARLGWARPTLDRRLNSDAHFPVRSRGGKGGGWEFDPDEVVAYLNGAAVPIAPPPADDEVDEDEGSYLVDLSEVRHERRAGKTEHRGEATARQQRDQADADLKMDKLRRMRLELVEAAAMRNTLETILVELRSSLLAMPDALVKEFDLPERVGFAMKGKIEGMMRSSVLTLKKQLAVTVDPSGGAGPE
jgi:phage terminase Nu1 subunit (DNA packaging protein)